MDSLLFLALGVFFLVQGSPEDKKLDHFQSGEVTPSSYDLARIENEVTYSNSRAKRTVMVKNIQLWPKNVTITYGYDTGLNGANYTDADRAWTKKQMDLVSEHTCLQTEEKNDGLRAVMFSKGSWCGTALGWKGVNSTHSIGMHDDCKWSVLHELFHALGSGHTIFRPDRDAFIAITPDYGSAWKYDEIVEQDPPVSFDFSSIMNNPANPPFLAPHELDYIKTMGNELGPPFPDWKHLNLRYKCGEECPQSVKCQNGGYPHPKKCNECTCTEFHSGRNCEKYEGYTISDGDRVVLAASAPFNETLYNQLGITQDFSLFTKFKLKPLRCRYIAIEIIDTKTADLTMGGKLYRGWAAPGWDYDFKVTVEVHDDNATTPTTPVALCLSCAANQINITQSGIGAKPMEVDVIDRNSAACATRTFTCLGNVDPNIEINQDHGVIMDGDDGVVDGAAHFAVTCNAAGTAWEAQGVPIKQVECATNA